MVHVVDDGGEDLAPVIPLFAGADASRGVRSVDRPRARVAFEPEADSEVATEPADRSAGAATEADAGAGRGRRGAALTVGVAAPGEVAVAAEKALVRRLASRELSIAESRAFLREREIDEGEAERILADFVERRYLDDARLAEQIIRIATERKGQGRQVIAMTLSSRGVPRDVADEALHAMPDDEDERALDFARDRARRLDGVEEQVALRRLLGQLARRGYGGHAATEAARTALSERRGGRTSGVRFS